MKKLCVFLLLALVAVAWAGDTYDKAVNTTVVSNDEVIYGGTFTLAAAGDSVGNFYTKGMYIGDCNSGWGYLTSLATVSSPGTTSDWDVYMQYSYDLATWVTSSKVLDALATTVAQTDTLNVQVGTIDPKFNSYPYCRIKFDGASTTNHCVNVVNWTLVFKKIQELPGQKTRVFVKR
jgi:hypothetical protein